jgi:AcrR family transcriptional regulator
MATLPRGRGSLPPQASAFLQRARLLDATARVVAEHGYAAATVSAIQARAGVSRRTFYDAFANKDAAVVAAFDVAARYAVPQLLGAFARRRGWAPGVDAALTTYLTVLEADRDWATLCLVGLPAAGERALAHRDRLLEPVVRTLAGGDGSRAGGDGSHAVAAGALAAVNGALHGSLADRGRPLLAARPELLALLIAPFRGSPAARRQAARPPAGVALRATAAERVRELLPAREPSARVALRGVLEAALRDGDGPALWQAAIGWHERRAAGARVDERLLERVLNGLEDAWPCGLPLAAISTGEPAGWLPQQARERCLRWLCEHPDSTAREIGAGAGIAHHSTVHRALAQLRRAGLASSRPGPGRAAIWRCGGP